MCPSIALVCTAVASVLILFTGLRHGWMLVAQSPKFSWPTDRLPQRFTRVLVDGIGLRRVRSHRLAGWAHGAIAYGFVLLLPRTVVLFGRAFDADFGGLVGGATIGEQLLLGYHWIKALTMVGVLLGIAVFAGLRLGRRELRFRPTPSALVILGVIAVILLTDLLYDAAGYRLAPAIHARCPTATPTGLCSLGIPFTAPFLGGATTEVTITDPLTQLVTWSLGASSDEVWLSLGLVSYALHLGLILGFAVLLPYTKHLHLVMAWPNLFFDSLAPTGKLPIIARDPEALLECVEAAEASGFVASRIGVQALCDMTPKQRLDWFACAACGRCTAHCPASATAKPLDPRQLNLDLRAHLQRAPLGPGDARRRHMALAVVPGVVAPRALWACTNCGACEEQCPVAVRTIGPIVELRRHQLMMQAAAPIELQRAFEGIERQGNPWNLPREARAQWSAGFEVPRLSEVQSVEYLYWVGCAASYDHRAQSVARAMVRLMQRAQVRFAILGTEERCTGDAARRAGNELLFLQLAEHNVRLLNRYRAEGRFERIIVTCPHCLTTLAHEYPDFGGRYDVVAHTVAIEQWLNEGRLTVRQLPEVLVTYHDPCTLARYAGITEAPRRLLRRLPGVVVTEPDHSGRHTFCCGAGGAQMWLKEQNDQPIHRRRAAELRRTGAKKILSACPFCLTMLENAGAAAGEGGVSSLRDIAEWVDRYCVDTNPPR